MKAAPLRRPLFWLVLQAVAVFAWLALSPGFEARWYVDTETYLAPLEEGSLAGSLSKIRTLGYPLFLAAAEALTGDVAAAAEAQLFLYLAAVVFFGWALGRAFGSPWRALAAASPLCYAQLVRVYGDALLTEVLAAALALATIAFVLLVVERPGALRWAGVAAFLFLTYLVRPAYLFLLPLVPLLGFLLALALRGWGEWRSSLRRPVAGLVLTALLPYAAWSGLRWTQTGHAGLVSFGGTNLIGIAGSLLAPEVLPQLPEAERPLAAAMLERRRELGLAVDGSYDFTRWYAEYNLNIFKAGLGAARELYAGDGTSAETFQVEANQRFSRLSRALLANRPGAYVRWVFNGFRHANQRTLEVPLVRWPALLLVVSIPVWLWRRRRAAAPLHPAAVAMALLAAAYTVASLLLVLLVEVPHDRYLFTCQLFLPGALVLLVAELWAPAAASATPPASRRTVVGVGVLGLALAVLLVDAATKAEVMLGRTTREPRAQDRIAVTDDFRAKTAAFIAGNGGSCQSIEQMTLDEGKSSLKRSVFHVLCSTPEGEKRYRVVAKRGGVLLSARGE